MLNIIFCLCFIFYICLLLYSVTGGGKHWPPEPIPGSQTWIRSWPCARQYQWWWGQLLIKYSCICILYFVFVFCTFLALCPTISMTMRSVDCYIGSVQVWMLDWIQNPCEFFFFQDVTPDKEVVGLKIYVYQVSFWLKITQLAFLCGVL